MSVVINASTTSGLVMTSDLSGNLQFQNNGVNLPMGGVAPAFSAYRTGTQAITASTWTKVQINTEEFDTANCFDSTTNYRFTPTVAGYYQVTGTVEPESALTYQYAAIYKNGSNAKRNSSSGASGVGVIVAALIFMNGSTDYIELYVNYSSAANLNGGSVVTYFQACLVRGA